MGHLLSHSPGLSVFGHWAPGGNPHLQTHTEGAPQPNQGPPLKQQTYAVLPYCPFFSTRCIQTHCDDLDVRKAHKTVFNVGSNCVCFLYFIILLINILVCQNHNLNDAKTLFVILKQYWPAHELDSATSSCSHNLQCHLMSAGWRQSSAASSTWRPTMNDDHFVGDKRSRVKGVEHLQK